VRRSLSLAALIALASAGCSGSTPHPPAPIAMGALIGRVTVSGGPATVRMGKPVSVLQNTPWSTGVTVTREQDSQDVVAVTHSDRSGRYTLTLAAGTYWVGSDCSPPQRVGIGQNQSTRLDMSCVVP
jgi:hypothetical protein